MDIFVPIIIFFVIFLLFCLCGVCARRRRNNGAIFSAPVVVTSATHQLPPGAANYPVTVAHGTIQSNYPTQQPPAGIVVAHPTYQMPQTGYPPMPQHGGANPPYPMVQQGGPNPPYPMTQPGGSNAPYPMQPQMPYPPQQYPGQVVAGPQFNPPSYDQVVGGGGVQQSPYQKQSPFNPGYSGN